jgi:hypothetical protein
VKKEGTAMISELKKDVRLYSKYWMILLFMLCAALISLPFLPATTATHWNANWQVDGWGTKWTVLSLPLVNALALLALNLVFTGMNGKITFGSRVASDPKGFLYHCWLIVSLFLCILEILMLAQGFRATVDGPHFLFFALLGAALLLAAAWKNRQSRASWILETAGFLLMLANLF